MLVTDIENDVKHYTCPMMDTPRTYLNSITDVQFIFVIYEISLALDNCVNKLFKWHNITMTYAQSIYKLNE